VLVLYMLQDVARQKEIEATPQSRRTLMNVVAIKRAQAAAVLFESPFIQLESGYGNAVSILDLPLHKAVPATDLGNARALPDDRIGQAPHHFEPPPDPKVVEVRNLVPAVGHTDLRGSR